MPGGPAETFVGVGAVGVGALMLFCAVKNVSPVYLLRQAVQQGNISLANLPALDDPNLIRGQAKRIVPSGVTSAIAKIATKDAGLAAGITTEVTRFTADASLPYSETKHFFDLMSQARALGFSAESDTIETYVNGLFSSRERTA